MCSGFDAHDGSGDGWFPDFAWRCCCTSLPLLCSLILIMRFLICFCSFDFFTCIPTWPCCQPRHRQGSDNSLPDLNFELSLAKGTTGDTRGRQKQLHFFTLPYRILLVLKDFSSHAHSISTYLLFVSGSSREGHC